MIGKTVSHYKIIEKLGEGGMGVVYKAYDTKLKRTVALKFLPSDLTRNKEVKQRFIQEAQAASSLDHPNICNIHEIDETEDGSLFMVMACYQGETLREKLKGGPLKLQEALNLAFQIIDGLIKAHAGGIVHRDIKPGNLFITNDGLVKIVDFGLSKLMKESRITKKGTTLGTTAYMSPEQVKGESIDERTDIWSLGVVIYEMITGHLPFRGEYDQAILYSILNEKPEPLTNLDRNVPWTLGYIVKKALNKQPEHRYQNILEILDDLEKVRSELPLPKKSQGMGRFSVRKLLAPIPILFFIVIIFLIVWVIKMDSLKWLSKYVPLDSNSIAVMPFDIMFEFADSEISGEMIEHLLINDLSQSHFIQVMRLQQLFDICNQIGLDSQSLTEQSKQFKIANKARVAYILRGSLYRSGLGYVLESQTIKVSSGELHKIQKIENKEINVYGMVDSLASKIKTDLQLPKEAYSEQDISIVDVTTSEPRAYLFFLQGERMSANYELRKAIQAYEEAVFLDTTFATAYVRLAWTYEFLLQDEKAKKALEKAYQNIQHTNERERYYLQLERALASENREEAKQILLAWIGRFAGDKFARLRLGNLYTHEFYMFEEAISQYKIALNLDPKYRAALNSLGYAYAHKEMKKKALDVLEKYVELAPEEFNPYDSMGEIYMNLIGDYKKAERALLKAYKIKPDFTPLKLAEVYQLKGQYQKAYEIIWQSLMVEGMAPVGHKYFLIARIYFQKQDYQKAMDFIRNAKDRMPLLSKTYWLSGLIHLKLNQISKAESDLRELARIDSHSVDYYHLLGNFYIAKSDFDFGIKALERPIQMIHGISDSYIEHREYYRQALAEVHFKIGNLDQTIIECQSIINDYPYWAQVYYLMGQVSEQKGWKRKALESYNVFLTIWKDADRDLPEIRDARERVSLLR